VQGVSRLEADVAQLRGPPARRRRQPHSIRPGGQERECLPTALAVCIRADFDLSHLGGHMSIQTAVDSLKYERNRLGLRADTRLTLIVEGAIQAGHVKIDALQYRASTVRAL